MNFIFITKECVVYPIADRLADDGRKVVVGLVPDEEGEKKSPEREKRRRALYDGILEYHEASDVLDWMSKLPNKDEWFVMLDYGDLWEWSEKILNLGFKTGIFPTERTYSLERDRQAGKEFAKKHYPMLKVAPVHEFKKVDDAIKLLDETKDKIFVLKSEGSNAETVVPLTSDFDLARRQIIGALKSETKGYEKEGFTLEEKIQNPIEITPVMLFWNGKPLFSLVEIENKPLGAGNIGRLSGGCQDLCIQTPLDCKLNKIAFPPIIYDDMAKEQPGIGIYDAGMLWDGKEFFFTEFCEARWGWDGIFSEIAMCGDADGKNSVTRHFEEIAQGKSPLRSNYGVAVRMFQTEPDSKHADVYQDGYAVDWLDRFNEQLFFYCIRKEGDQFVSVGYEKDFGVATGTGATLQEAVNRAYAAAEGVAMTGLLYRPKFDFLSLDYPTSIMKRYEWLMKSGLIGENKTPQNGRPATQLHDRRLLAVRPAKQPRRITYRSGQAARPKVQPRGDRA